VQKPRADEVVVALIGDLVSSRHHPDRADLQHRLVAALAGVEQLVPSVQPLDVTIGDEFQGAYATLADAATAALLVRLRLLPDVDTRYGLGRGTVTVFDAGRDPVSQDGPAWWAAREAIGQVERTAASPRGRTGRNWFAEATSEADPDPTPGATPGTAAGAGTGVGTGTGVVAAVNAFLSCRDDIIGRMSPRAQRLLHGLLLGEQQTAMAQAEGISQSAVSQSLSSSGAYAVLRSAELLREVG
jgi:SatD family (SatD)